MTNTTDNVGALYKALKQKGFSDIGTEDVFRDKLQDENNRKQLYDALHKSGYNDIGDYNTFNTRVAGSYQFTAPVQGVDANYTAGQVSADDMGGDVPEYLQRPEEQETIKGFVPGFKQGSDALYQGVKSSVGEAANLLTGSSRDYTKAQVQLRELMDSGYELSGFDKEKALKDYKDRQFQRDMDSWEEMMQQRRKEREGMGFLDALVHKFKDPDRPRDQYDSSAVAFNKKKVGDEVQLGRAFDAIQEALTQANGDVEKAYNLLGKQSAKETWGDETSREAREAMREFKPTEGAAAWVGNMVPQMVGNAAAIAASVSPYTRWLARPLGAANMGMLTASSSGSAMAEAREYAEQTGVPVSEGDVLRVGAVSGAIEAGTEMLPYNRFFGGIQNFTAKKLGKEVTNVIAGNPAARRELSSLLRDAGSDLSTKLFTKEAGKKFLGDVSIEGFSEFLAEGGGTLVPMIYQNPEDYPTLYEVLENGWEGAKGGIFMGSILGGASSTVGHYQNRARRKQQGKVMLADTKDGVLEVVGQTGEDKYMAVDSEGMPHEISRNMVNDFQVVDFQEFDTYCREQTEENLQKAVENGRSLAEDTDRSKKHAAKLELDKASRGLTPEMIEEMDGVSPADYLASHEDVAGQVLPYLNAKAKYEGLIQGVREGIDGKIEQSNTYIDKNTHTDGRIYSARLKVDDEPVSIVSGDVALDESGLIDKERSAGRFIVVNSKGELQMRDRDDILSVDGISDAFETKLTTAETIRQQEAQRAADEIEGKRDFVQGEEVETYLNGMRVLVGVQAQNEDGTITVTDGKNEILTTREELQRGVDIVEQMRIDEELAAEQQSDVLSPDAGTEGAYALNTELSFQTENGVVRGSVTNERNADGLIEVWTEEPLNGKKVNLFTEEELNGLLNPVSDIDPVNNEVLEEAEPIAEVSDSESAPVMEEIEQEEVVPTNDKGVKVWHEAKPETTLRELSFLLGNEEDVIETVTFTIEGLTKELEKLQTVKPKVSPDINAVIKDKAYRKQKIDDVQAKLDYWNNVLSLTSYVEGEEVAAPVADVDMLEWTAENSTDLNEVVTAYNEAKELASHDIKLQPWEQALLGRKVSTDSFVRFSDKNYITGQLAKAWLRKDGIGIDQIQKEFEMEGLNVSEQDIVDFMLRHPSNYVRTTSDTQNSLGKRFSEIATKQAGMPIGGPESVTGRLFLQTLAQGKKLEGIQQAIEKQATQEDEVMEETLYQSIPDNAMGADEEIMHGVLDGAEYIDGEFVFNDTGMTVEEIDEIYSELELSNYGRETETENSQEDGIMQPFDEAREIEELGTQEVAAKEDREAETGNSGTGIDVQEEKLISSQEAIVKAEQEVDSSPSEAQKEAGNYKKGHVKIDGLDVTIENPKGSERSGVDEDGKPWSVTMNNTYGYIRGTEGVDGDHIDIFLGKHVEAPNVFVVDQVKPDGSFDEHKVMYGFKSALAAKRAYLKNYSAGWKGLGNITGVSKEVFREWIDSSHRKTKPFNEYKSVRDAVQSEVTQSEEQTEAVVTGNESGTKDAGVFTVEDADVIRNNPLTVEEIEGSAVEHELKTLAKDYLAGNESFINLVAYQNIYNDVRNRTRGIEPNSTGAGETQLDEVINGNQRGLESGFGRGEADNVGAGGSETPVSGSGRSGKTGKEQPALFDGERGDHEVRGEEPAVDGVSSGRGYSDGSGSTGGNGRNVSRPTRSKTGGRGTKNDTGRRANAGHERVDSVGKGAVSVDADLQNALDDFKDILHQFGKAGKNDMSLSLVGLNKEQIQLLPKLVSSGVKLGYQLIRKEVYDFKKWAEQMRSFIGEPLKQAIGYGDTDVNAFIQEMWNSKFEMDGEVHTLAEWSAKLGTKELKKQVSATLEEKRAQQMAAEFIPVEIADAQNIDETLPYLLPQQREDVRLAEIQFFDESHQDREHGNGKGYLFTNGTGTGKTYTGLGIVKRFIKQGKNRILVVTPSQPKVTDWMKDAANLGIELRDLDTLSKGRGTTATTEKGEGAVITTFANLRQNKALLEDTFDLIVYDESHRIMENKQGEATIGTDVHFMITNRNAKDALRRYSVINPKYQAWQKAQEVYKKEMESSRLLMQHAGDNEIGAKGKEYEKRLEDAKAAVQSTEKEWKEEEGRLKPLVGDAVKTTKTVFLSATPFNTRESLSYTEGYIFSYPKENTNTVGSYHHHSPQTEFYLTHFGAGYKFRYGRLERGLTNADALVKQEVAFSDYLENELGTKSGRIIDSEYDYSRDFPMVTLKRAQDINDAIEGVWREDALNPLSDALRQVWFNYNYTSALLETMKISATIPRMREHLKMGRKVVVFHRRVQSKDALRPPFRTMLSIAREQVRSESDAETKKKLRDAIALFEKRHEGLLQYEQTLDYSMPREQIAEAFGEENVLFFSGKESGKTKNKAVELFNDDDSGKNIIVIQEASGKEGISLHDTSGKHQRVLITLALPQSPITALQIEGRIYRIGNRSNAIFEYPLLGLDSEMILFGQQFNQQVSTTENLALGSKARDLRSSFTRGVEEHTNVPLEQQGLGGKEFDKGKEEMADPYEDAVLDYYGNQKVKGRRDNREGMDYFATPEPVGFKMVEWAMPQEGESALEPSAGHGAIARYVSRDVSLTAIEPSNRLFGKLQLKAGGMGRKFVNDLFENYAFQNKHDVIVMNPPFGTAGKKAMDHLEKAFDHLTEGGRVVALIPRGQMDKRFEKWYGEKKEAVVTAEINLPPCTFEQAGTSVYTRVVVIDRIGREETRLKAPQRRSIDLSDVKTVKELFERMKDVSVPKRTIDEVARNMKNAKKTVKEFKEIKGVDVVVDTDGVYAYGRSGMTLFSQRFDSESMANIPNEYARMHYWIEANGTGGMGNRAKERIEVYVTGMKTLRNLTGKTHEQLMEESEGGNVRFRLPDSDGVNGNPAVEQAEIRAEVEELADTLHTPIRIVRDTDEISDSNKGLEKRKKQSKGWFDSETGEVVLVLPNAKSVEDARATVFHEVVAHKGLRGLLGNEFTSFLDGVYKNVSESMRREVVELSKKHGWDLRVGMEEYMAGLAERGFADRESSSVWNKIKNAFMDAVHRLKIELGFRLQDNDLRYILWKSYQNLKGGNGILELAQDIAFQHKLGVGSFRKDGAENHSNPLNSGSESVYLQQTNNNDDVSESISQRINGKMPEEDKELAKAAFGLRNRIEAAERDAREAGRAISEREKQEIEQRAAESYGKEHNLWIPMQKVFAWSPMPSGNENDVYLNTDNGYLYKVNNLMNSKGILLLFERINLHNQIFPQTGYEFVGFTGFDKGSIYPIFRQLYVHNSTFATPEDIDAYMNKLGFKQTGEAAYSNGEYVISDLRPRNVLKDADGDIYVVDADFKSEGSDKGGGIRFRDGDSSSGEAMREYEGAVKTNLYKFQEAYQDSMLGLLKLQESVVKETKTDLADNENAYMAENQLSSRNAYEMEFYKDRFFKPMMDAVKGFIKHGRSYEDVKVYMMAKSGLERNEVFAMRDAQRIMDERVKELETLLDINAISEEEFDSMRAMAEEQRNADYAENRKRDYSGLSSLMDELEHYEEMAQELVEHFEEGNEKAVAELWKRVNDATKSTLQKTYKSGMMTKGVYEHVRGMFEFYIPMRGWTEDVAADVYDYILSERSPFNAPVKAAQGRTSLADDPLATIGNMAESAIMQGNRNMMKQKFLNLVENHPTSLATVQKVWYENMGTEEEPVWEQSFPDIPENASADEVAVAIEEHEARMKELKENGMAKDERSGVNLKYRASKREKSEHIVVVKRGGREYAVYVNGNPRAAQAINGLTNPDTIEHKGVKLVQRLNRQLAANFTTRNPAFVLSNLSRDLIFSTTAIAIKEKGKYARRFNANIAKNTLGMVKLMKRYQDGKLDMGKERDRLFKEFLENGGETGYTALHSVDEYKKLIDREVMDAKGKVDLGRVFGLKPGKVTTSTTLGIVPAFQLVSKWTEFGNRCAEDVSRFTAYMTSRQEGRSVQRSVADAKEITVNFNKKGAGGYGATTFKSLYLFFNAGVQSLNNFYRLSKANPKRFNSALLGFTAAGVLLPMLNEFLIDMWGDDDDKDKYDNLPEWVRRNNFCFWLGGDRFVTVPLPIELRAFYGMGEIFNQWTKGNMKHKNVGYELVNQVTELIPLNPLGGNGDVVSSFVPDAGKPFYQVMTNKDFFGKPIYKETDFNVLMPEFTKAFKGTSSALVASSELLNEVTGGDKYTRGWANVNPAKVEHVFEGYFGGMGKTINQMGKTIGMIWDEDQRVMRNVPVVNRFLNKTDDRNAFSRVNEEYYHYLDEFRETEQRLKGYEKEADLGIMEYAEKVDFLEYSKEHQRYEIFKDYQEELKGLQTEIKEAVDKEEREFLENELNFVKMELVERLNETEE